MCLYTKMIKNPKYKPTKKNGGKPPFCNDARLEYIPAECGECPECRKKKQREWVIRLCEELKENFGYFITLTIDENYLRKIQEQTGLQLQGNENEIAKYAMRHFLERVRKETKKSLRHWAVTELGEEKGRIHLHAVMFGQRAAELTKKHWKYGNIFMGNYTNERTIRYITKYMLKFDEKHPLFKGEVLSSKGLGLGYINREGKRVNKYRGKATNELYRFRNGKVAELPTIYRNHIYSDEEREKLWLQKLDKGEIWVHGEKFNIPKITDINSDEQAEEVKEELQRIEETTQYYRRTLCSMQHDNEEAWEKRAKHRKLMKQQRRAINELAKESRGCARWILINGKYRVIDIATGEIIK